MADEKKKKKKKKKPMPKSASDLIRNRSKKKKATANDFEESDKYAYRRNKKTGKIEKRDVKKSLTKEAKKKGKNWWMDVGGGEPIPLGDRRTNEERVDQPRDSKGQFEYNSTAGLGRKYPYHGVGNPHGKEGKTDNKPPKTPVTMENISLNGYKQGDKIVLAGRLMIVTKDVTYDMISEIMKRYSDDLGFYMEDEEGVHRLDDLFTTAKGRKGEKAKEAEKESGKATGVSGKKVGELNLDAVSEQTLAKLEELSENFGELAENEGNVDGTFFANEYHVEGGSERDNTPEGSTGSGDRRTWSTERQEAEQKGYEREQLQAEADAMDRQAQREMANELAEDNSKFDENNPKHMKGAEFVADVMKAQGQDVTVDQVVEWFKQGLLQKSKPQKGAKKPN